MDFKKLLITYVLLRQEVCVDAIPQKYRSYLFVAVP